jgi:hypothetical protein
MFRLATVRQGIEWGGGVSGNANYVCHFAFL